MKKRQPKRSMTELNRLIQFQEGLIAGLDLCLNDAADRAANCFLAGQDETAKELRNQLRRFQVKSQEANGCLCDLLCERR